MLGDSEVTNRESAKHTPFLSAYLELVEHAYRAIRLRGELLAMLEWPGASRESLYGLAEQLLSAWEGAEQATGRMADAKQHQEQALTEQASLLLDHNGQGTADALTEVAFRFVDSELFERATKLRDRAQLRRSSQSHNHADVEPVQS